VIFFDNTLAPMASYLKAGTTQLVLAMLEAGWIDADLLLDDPLAAASEVSRDLTFKEELRLAGRGRTATAVEIQRGLAELAGEFVASGEADEAVPDAEKIVEDWLATLEMIERRDLAALAKRVDWALKYLVLDRQRSRRGLSWDSPEVRALDLRYASLDPQEGLFLQLAKAGQVERMPSEEEIDAAADEPPTDSRAYLRAQILRRLGDEVQDMDWDHVRFSHAAGRYRSGGLSLGMPEPWRWGKDESDPVLESCPTVKELIEAVGEPEAPEWTKYSAAAWGQRNTWSWTPSTQDW
jgi:proteasome accessory factor A